ncbi:hypothetical protein [Psychromonas antarctica]|uniref:hypothetical protein n=1 Tax=Psychromonas antarctica TaxID=67573 RepID=UPI001EE8A2FF|nr:hypothetical protein [Psychromonas antarctica]MCG6201434.1 hypothetical protein [Psychromonas antarctica]
MSIISTLRIKQKTLIIATSLLLCLALTPTTSIAANAEKGGYRNNDTHNTYKQQGSRHAKKNIRHQNNGQHNKHRNKYNGHHNKHAYVDCRHHRYEHNKHRSHYHRKAHHMLNNHYHPDRFAVQIGDHTGRFSIFVRD